MHLESVPVPLCRFPAFAALVLFAAVSVAGDTRPWVLRTGQRVEAELLAVDGLRATLGNAGTPKWIVPLSDFAPADAEHARGWRKADPQRPLVDPRLLAAWPPRAAADAVEVRATGEAAGEFRYESPHFAIQSDLKLPVAVVRDLAMVFEATRAALIALPLGLHAGGETEKYPVLLTSSTEAYTAAGGGTGTGGYFEPRKQRMLVFLPNLGIEAKASGTQLRYTNQLFVLKHEVCHQLLARWHRGLPYWLHEGLPEYIASLPYVRGRYSLQNPGAGMRDYLLKWREGPNDRTIRVVPPARLMEMDSASWNQAVAQLAAYDLYNSANLLTYYFIQQGGGTRIAAFLEALRRGEDAGAAQKTHLLGGREPASLTAELIALARRIGLEPKLTE